MRHEIARDPLTGKWYVRFILGARYYAPPPFDEPPTQKQLEWWAGKAMAEFQKNEP